MLSDDTKNKVFEVLVEYRYQSIREYDRQDCFDGISMAPLEEMTDAQLVEEYACCFDVLPDEDELYDKMVAEISAHNMLLGQSC